MARWILFILMLTIGAAGGLYYGWVINPAENVVNTPQSLRSDYRADYVLMIAEAYHYDGDLTLAINRLSQLGDPSPMDSVAQALIYAVKVSPPYPEVDLTLMRVLAEDLGEYYPEAEAVQ